MKEQISKNANVSGTSIGMGYYRDWAIPNPFITLTGTKNNQPINKHSKYYFQKKNKEKEKKKEKGKRKDVYGTWRSSFFSKS